MVCVVSPIQWDFVEQIMKFDYMGKQECLTGITNNLWEVISLDEMAKEMKVANQIEVVQLFVIEMQEASTVNQEDRSPELT